MTRPERALPRVLRDALRAYMDTERRDLLREALADCSMPDVLRNCPDLDAASARGRRRPRIEAPVTVLPVSLRPVTAWRELRVALLPGFLLHAEALGGGGITQAAVPREKTEFPRALTTYN